MSLTRDCSHTKKPTVQSCRICALSSLCLPAALDEAMIDELKSIVTSDRRFDQKQVIYSQGDPFQSLHVVKSGAVKTYITDTRGDEHITGFYLPGEIIGLESIAGRKYLSTATSLTDSYLCKANYPRLAQLRKNNPALSDWAINLFSQSLASGHEFFNCLSHHSAVSRLATFILVISKRTGRADRHQLSFTLPMSRQDIGNYLGLASETTSRAFSRLVETKCIEKKNRQINIIDLSHLMQLSALDSAL
ncbi:MAG: helix-turn-helix domain-containing protein [Cycloclasticus sp.]|nr:helix-turn-helix domain-containing protein [Cycloclasticus sp.]